jgi:hypothetical protein
MAMILHSGYVPALLGRAELDAAALWKQHPPRIAHRCKRAIFDLAGGASRIPRGALVVSRWGLREPAARAPTLPEEAPVATSVAAPFDYAPPRDRSDVWWVNFANAHLFCAYGGAAFAQDELQVAEHPILASVLEALTASPVEGLPALTREGGRPTPITIRGAERWCAIDTDPDLASPYGIYGRRLDRATDAVLAQAVTRLEPGTQSNVLAMEAPQGRGRYTKDQIGMILETAMIGFSAAKVSARFAGKETGDPVVVHTGHWGTGAYGGNRVLMAIAQLVAARFAELTELVYHSLDDEGVDDFEEGRRVALRITRPGMTLDEVADALVAHAFEWGVSDGN